MTAQKLGGKLAAWMELEGLTDRQLAERLRMDASYIWMLRTGTRPISDGFRWRFGRAYGFELATKIFAESATVRTDMPVAELRTD